MLEAQSLGAADVALQDAYRRQPQDPRLIEAARRLAGKTTPAW